VCSRSRRLSSSSATRRTELPQSNRDRIEAVYREWAQGNFRAGGELFSPDVAFEAMSDGRSAIGRDAIAGYMRAFLGQWSEFRIAAERIEERGDQVVVTERQRGTGRASGIELDMTAYAAWTFRDGEVVHVRWSTEPPT
jgi:ketosteroid isomerase-like protein